MEAIYEKIIFESSKPGAMRWNEICNDIVTVYFEIFTGEKLYRQEELWALLFEPLIKKNEKEEKLKKKVLDDTANKYFFLNILPQLLEDNFNDVDKFVNEFLK